MKDDPTMPREWVELMEKMQVWEATGMSVTLPASQVRKLRKAIVIAIEHSQSLRMDACENLDKAIAEREEIDRLCDKAIKTSRGTRDWAYLLLALCLLNLAMLVFDLVHG